MELQYPSISVLFAFLLFMLMVVKVVKRSKGKNSTAKLPPGPWQLPLIGNMHQLMGSQLPHHILRDLAEKYGPLMHLKLGELSTIIVSSPEIAKEVLKTHDIIFSERPYLLASTIMSYDCIDIVFSPYGDYWRQLRKICITELLSSKRVQTFRSIREEEVSNLISSISSNIAKSPLINLSNKIFSLIHGITSRAAFGEKSKDQEEFISIMVDLLRLASGFSIADMYPSVKILSVISGVRTRLEEMHKRSDQILENILNQHKEGRKTKQANEDLVDVLLKFQEDGNLENQLTDNSIKAVILDVFSAGSESTTTIEWAMSEMFKNPTVMAKAQAEVREVFDKRGDVDEMGLNQLNYLKLVIKETLRLHPPAPLLVPRECSAQCEINGYQIPAKTRVIVNGWAIGRDPRYWTEAERFQPERFIDSPIDFKGTHFEFIPFGAGRRICPGILFALPLIELPLAQLLYHFNWKLPNGLKQEELDMTEAVGITVRRKNDLYLIPDPYVPSIVES